MKNFLLGLAVGAAAAYVTSKIVDDKTREEIFGEIDKAAKQGRGQALRMRVRARQEVRKGKKKLSKAAGDLAGKLSEELAEYEGRMKPEADAQS